MLFQFFLIIHIILALALVALILLQQGKGADAGPAFGSGSAGSVFGARGANSFIYKVTAGIAAAFFLTSITLAYLAPERQANNASESKIQATETQLNVDTPSVDIDVSADN